MRVLLVLCLAAAFVAAQEDGDATTSAPETILGCIQKAIRAGIDRSKGNFRKLLEQVSPKEDIGGVMGQIAVEYDLLQQKMDNTTRTILADRETCEKNNQEAVFKRNCDLLAKLSFVPKGTRHVAVLVKNCISIISKAHLNFAKGGAGSVIQFIREQSTGLYKNLREAVTCIRSRK